MELLVTVTGVGDRMIGCGASVTVADLVAELGGGRGQTFTLHRTGASLDRSMALTDTDLRTGDRIELRSRSTLVEAATGEAPATLKVLAGPSIGTAFELTYGTTTIGRVAANDIAIVDPGLSRRHATIAVSRNHVLVTDNGSTNGVLVNGVGIEEPTLLSPGDQLTMGETVIVVEHRFGAADTTGERESGRDGEREGACRSEVSASEREEMQASPDGAPRAAVPEFHRRSRSLNLYEGKTVELPSPPEPMGRFNLSRVALARHERDEAAFIDTMGALAADLTEEHETERSRRLHEAPAIDELASMVASASPRLWERTVGDPDLLWVRIGLGRLPSRCRIVHDSQAADPRVAAFVDEHATVGPVPAVIAMHHSTRLAGPQEPVTGLAASLLAQLAALHSPADLAIAAFVGAGPVSDWEWLKWLPHCRDGRRRFGANLLASTDAEGAELSGALTELIDRRRRLVSSGAETRRFAPVVVMVDENGPISADAVDLVGRLGPDLGVHLLWLAVDEPRIDQSFPNVVTILGRTTPERTEARTAAWSTPVHHATIESPDAVVSGIDVELCEPRLRQRIARDLAPIVDRSGRSTDDGLHVPPFVLGSVIGDVGPDAVTARWSRQTDGLAVPVAKSAHGPIRLDLLLEGPHAMVVGDPGSGKTRLLEAWVTSLAATHGPDRLEFRLAGSPGAQCGLLASCGPMLPHSTVTATDPLEARSLLAGLTQEVARRSELVALSDARSVAELRLLGRSGVPADLIVVIDDLLDWVDVAQDFVGGLVELAARAGHLGLHLVAAIDGERFDFLDLSGASVERIRSLSGIRLCLRVADADVAKAVVGSEEPTLIDRATSGRGYLAVENHEPVLFQGALACAGALAEDVLVVGPFEFGGDDHLPAPCAENGIRPAPGQLLEAVRRAGGWSPTGLMA